MNKRIEVDVAEETRIPYAHVSSADLWDLVEYLSWQRVRVSYTHSGQDFVVSFMGMEREAAQRMLDHWMEHPECQSEEAASPVPRIHAFR